VGRENWRGEPVSGGQLREWRPGSGSQCLRRLTLTLYQGSRDCRAGVRVEGLGAEGK
jgi:hypothetical protein